jgi:hypothetical protein
MDRIDHIFLQLVALGLGNEVPFDPDLAGRDPQAGLKGIDWQAVIDRAGSHGLDAVAWDGLKALYEKQPWLTEALDESLGEIKYDWLALTLQVEQDYDAYERTLGELAAFYNEEGFPVMILKGYGLSLDYPVPRHRPTGDIDIYLFGRWKEADRALRQRKGILADNSHHHHSVFRFGGRHVENHYDLINVHSRPSNRRLEPILKAWAGKDTREWELERGSQAPAAETSSAPAAPETPVGEVPAARILLPGPDFNALFLLRHSASHFASVNIRLRHVLDWLLFVRAHGAEVDWDALYAILRRENMDRYANSLNAIGVRYLGFDPAIFPAVKSGQASEPAPALESDTALVDRILEEILHPAFTDKEDGTLAHSLRVKTARWWANRWKYRLVFADSLPAAFLHSLFAKFLKPKSFVH